MYLASSLGLAFALVVEHGNRAVRALAGAAIPLSCWAMLLTLSRGALISGAVATLLVVIFASPRTQRRLVPAVTVGVAFLAFGPAAELLAKLAASTTGSSEAAVSAQYRVRLFSLFLDPQQFSLLGHYLSSGGSAPVNTVGLSVGFPSFDNQFALIYLVTGAIPLVAFVVVCVFVWRQALRRGSPLIDRGWAAGAAATMVGLATVGLLTQQGDLLWVSVAIVASASQDARAIQGPWVRPKSAPGARLATTRYAWRRSMRSAASFAPR
jgi:hypothetical protein